LVFASDFIHAIVVLYKCVLIDLDRLND